jgi:hypothetical protein
MRGEAPAPVPHCRSPATTADTESSDELGATENPANAAELVDPREAAIATELVAAGVPLTLVERVAKARRASEIALPPIDPALLEQLCPPAGDALKETVARPRHDYPAPPASRLVKKLI